MLESVESRGMGRKRKPATNTIEYAIENIGGTYAEVAEKLGLSRPTLDRRRREGWLDPDQVPQGEIRRWVKESKFDERLLTVPPPKNGK